MIAALVLGCLFGVCQASELGYVPRRHSLNVASAFDTPAEYDAAFGFDNWNVPAKYLDLVVAPPGTVDRRVRAACEARAAIHIPGPIVAIGRASCSIRRTVIRNVRSRPTTVPLCNESAIRRHRVGAAGRSIPSTTSSRGIASSS